MYFLYFILFLLNCNGNYKSIDINKKSNYYIKLLNLLKPQIIKNSQDIIHWKFFKNFYQVVYNYPNFLGYGMGLNYFELLKETKRKTFTEQIIDGFLNQQIISLLADIIINRVMNFSNFNESQEIQESIQKKQTFYIQCLSVFVDNWLEEGLNFQEFFKDIEIIQKHYNNNDYIYCYYSIISNDLKNLELIYKKVINGEPLFNFREECIFFNIIQVLFNGNMNPIELYKTTYPSRVNYIVFKKYFFNNNIQIYPYNNRYVLTEIYDKQPINNINLKDIIIKDLSLENINNPKVFKSLLLKNFYNFDGYLQNIFLLYFFLKKFESYGNFHKKNQYSQYIFWLLSRYYNNHFQKQWIKKIKDEEEKKQQEEQKK